MSISSEESVNTPDGISLVPHESDATRLREVFAHFPTGVAALSATVDGEDHVFVASSFQVGISLEPALVLVAIQKTSETWPALKTAPRIGVSVFAEDQGGLARQLAGRDRDARWNNVATHRTASGAIVLDSAAIALETSIYGVQDAGDHVVALLEVHDVHVDVAREPLIWHGSRFRTIAAS